MLVAPAFLYRVEEEPAVEAELGGQKFPDEVLKTIAQELVKAVRESTSIDWNLKESVRAALRAKVRRLLNRYDYPPDKEERAIQLVLEQAELLAND